MQSVLLRFSSIALVLGLSLLAPTAAQAALYAPGETLDPACAPTDVNCGVASSVGSGTTGQTPYYAASGGVLTATSTLTVLQNGNVGVGTTSPVYKLDVAGFGRFTGPVDAANFVATSTSATSTFAGGFTAGNSIAFVVNRTASANTLYLSSSGNVGIGTSSPSAFKLQVAGNIGPDANNVYALGSTTRRFSNLYATKLNLNSSDTNNNLWIGDMAGDSITTGHGNLAIGPQMAGTWTTANENTAIGWLSMWKLTTGFGNTALGAGANGQQISGNENTAVGWDALSVATSSNNTAVGSWALGNLTTGTGVAVGRNALILATTGTNNVAVGTTALFQLTTGSNNIAMGAASLGGNGNNNVSIGTFTMLNNTTGSSNIAIGTSMGVNTTGSNNVVLGDTAMSGNISGINNVAIGTAAGVTATVANKNVSGGNNIFIGYQAGPGSATQHNFLTVIGSGATGDRDNALILGRSSDAVIVSGTMGVSTTTPFANLSIHANNGSTNRTLFAIGSSTISATTTLFSVANTGDVTINGSSGSTCTIGNGTGGTSCTSDERLKTEVALIVDPLKSIGQLRGVTFKWSDQSKDQSQFIGVIAQDVQKIFPQAVTTTAGGYLSVDYASLVAPLIEAVKEVGSVSGEFRINLTAWLGSAANGISDLYASTVHTQNLCVGSTCITETELKAFLQDRAQAGSPPASAPIIITDVPPAIEEGPATTTPETSSTTQSEEVIPDIPPTELAS